MSTPAGAAVTIDGKAAGKTPLTVLGKPGLAIDLALTTEAGGSGSAQATLTDPGGRVEVSLE